MTTETLTIHGLTFAFDVANWSDTAAAADAANKMAAALTTFGAEEASAMHEALVAEEAMEECDDDCIELRDRIAKGAWEEVIAERGLDKRAVGRCSIEAA